MFCFYEMEDIQNLLHDPNCSDEVIEHVYRDMFKQKRDRLENLVKEFSSRESIGKQVVFRLDLNVNFEQALVTDVVFCTQKNFNFSAKDVYNLSMMMAKEGIKINQFLEYIEDNIQDDVDRSSYHFTAFVISVLMLCGREFHDISYLRKISPKQDDAYEIYSRLKGEILREFEEDEYF
jgi:hypothetical protein